MKVDFVNPFLEAAKSVIETMAFTPVTPGKPAVKQDNLTWGIVSGVIGLASAKLKGNMVLSFDEGAILGIVSKMLGEEFQSIGPDVVDAVGELTNMISGNAKKALSEKGFVFDMAIPVMIIGKDVAIGQFTKGPIITVPFETEKGKFVIEANLREV